MGSKQLRLWGRLAMQEQVGEGNPPSDEHTTKEIKHALDTRDALLLYRKARSVLHVFCEKITVVSAAATKDGVATSQVVWNSRIHCPNSHNVAFTHLDGGAKFTVGTPSKYSAPTAGLFAAAPGCLIVVSVVNEFWDVVPLAAAYLPQAEPDSELLARVDLEADDIHAAVLCTLADGDGERNGVVRTGTPVPLLLAPLSVGSPLQSLHSLIAGSPLKGGVANENRDLEVVCELCGILTPVRLTVVLTQCGHSMCIACATACCSRHVSVRDATPLNMLCPHFACHTRLLRSEVRRLCANQSDFTALEFNELRGLLGENATQCPKCLFLFERVVPHGLDSDPLKDKLICVACHATFCAACRTHPFHEGRLCVEGGSSGSAAPRCRYCHNEVNAKGGSADVCDAAVCQAKGALSCVVPKKCGHRCHGTCGERSCVACLEEGCEDCHPVHTRGEYCAICFTDTLDDSPCLQLDCSHVFHRHCLEAKLTNKWPTSRINFQFLNCPLCSQQINHHLLSKLLAPIQKLQEALDSRMHERLRLEGLHSSEALTDPSSPFYEKPLEFARSQFNYYQCSVCERPYYGGLRRCQDVEREEPNKKDLVCGGCSAGSATCSRHGPSNLEWKCKYCCNTAVWFCWGTTHFCELCHSPPRKTVREACRGEEQCPLKAMHPPNGTEFAIGCSLCRSGNHENTAQ